MLGRKQSRKPKDKLKVMKRFIMGEDVVEDIFSNGIPRITGFLLVDSGEKIVEITKDKVIWHEQKTYPDPEIEGVSYSNPANVPERPKNVPSELSEHSNKKKTDARIEPVIASQTKEEKHRQMLQQQKEALDKEQKEYAVQRAQRILNSQANQSYHEWLCRNL